MAKKKILCGAKDCDGVIAHQLTDKTLEIGRRDQMVTTTLQNGSAMATCPINPSHQTAIVVTDGVVDASGLRYGDESDHLDAAVTNEDE